MTGASGVGKDTIRREALPVFSNLHYSISATTRKQRPGEIEGQNYYFVEKDRFQEMIRHGELLEYAEYVDDYYGTPVAPVVEALERGEDGLIEHELAGARQVRERLPEARMLFIAPPSLAELERRLRGRGTDSEEKIQRRLARARDEIRAVHEFDYVVVNDHLPSAIADFQGILRAERARAHRLSDEDVEAFLADSQKY